MRVSPRSGVAAAALATCAALVAASAQAGPVTLFKQNGSDTFDGGGKLHVNLSAPSANALAGGFRLKDQDNDGFVAWCLDIMNNLSIPGEGRAYTTTETPFAATSGALSPTTKGHVEGLFETAYSFVDLTDDVQSAGFQMALWEVLYEQTASFDLTNGTFQQNKSGSAQDSAEAAANSYLDLMEAGVVTQSLAFTYYESATNATGTQLSQNLVSVAAVPLPAAAWMLGLGIAGLYGARRRQKV